MRAFIKIIVQALCRPKMIAKIDEEVNMDNDFRFVDPQMPWRNLKFTNCTAKPKSPY